MQTKHKNEVEDDIEMVINMTNRNGKRMEEHNKKKVQKEKRKVQKRKKRMKKIIKWTSITILTLASLVFALVSPIFNINEIKVENNIILTDEKIISLSGLSKNQNIFRFLKSDVEKYIKEEPYIESVKIDRLLPNTVQIEVKERNRDFCLKFLNSYAYINNQGYILEISEEKLNLPVIEGAETAEEEIKPGNRLNNNDLKKLEIAIQIMTIAKEKNIDSKISGIDISDKNEYILYLSGEKKQVYLGNSSDLNTKFLYIVKMLELEAGKEGILFENGDFTKNFKPYFREKV